MMKFHCYNPTHLIFSSGPLSGPGRQKPIVNKEGAQ